MIVIVPSDGLGIVVHASYNGGECPTFWWGFSCYPEILNLLMIVRMQNVINHNPEQGHYACAREGEK